MRLGISALLFNLDKALELCREVDKINHIEVGIDNLDECIKLSKYKGEFDKLNLSLGIHLPMELNSCENIKYIRKSWIDFINKIEDGLKDLNIEYFNMHLGYVISERLYKNRIKYLDNSVSFFEELLKVSNKRLSIENTYSKNGDFSNIGYICDDFEYIFNKIKSQNLKFKQDWIFLSKWGNIILSTVGVAQLVRVSHCGCEGWGFESPRSPSRGFLAKTLSKLASNWLILAGSNAL